MATYSTKNILVNELDSVSNIFTFNKGYMTLAMSFGSHQPDNDHNYLSTVIIIVYMYSPSDLGFSSNLIGSLSKLSIMCDPNKTKWPS